MSQTKTKSDRNHTKRSKGSQSKSMRRTDPKGAKYDPRSQKYEGSPANDPRYYANNPILTALTTAIPINPVLGTKEIWHQGMNISGSVTNDFTINGTGIPGIMGITLVPAFGSDMGSSTASSASFNRLCANLYSMLVRDKSGTAPFDQAAVGHYLTALRSAYIVVHDLKRFVSLMTYFQAGNRYFPNGIMYGMGRGGASLSASEIDAATWEINKLVRFLNTKFVPKMSVFQRDYDLYSRLYADSDTEYCQYYAFIPRGYYVYDDANNISKFKPFGNLVPNLPKSLANIQSIVTELIDSMQNSDIFNIITSWMRHVYTPGDTWQLEEMAFGAQPTFVYDEYVLAQIENLRALNANNSLHWNGFDITQSGGNNYLEYSDITSALSTPTGDTYHVGLSMNPVFNFHVTNPTEDMKLESSRLSICAREEVWSVNANSNTVDSVAGGYIFSDQIPNFLLMAVWDEASQAFVQHRFFNAYAPIGGYDSGYYLSDIVPLISMFKRHPLIWVTSATVNASNEVQSVKIVPVGQIDTVGSVDKDAFERMSYTCTYSLFSVPGITV